MSIKNRKSSSIDGQWIRENETKEYKFDYSDDEETKTEYQRAVEMLARIKNEDKLLFKGMLDAKLRYFERNGIAITREQLINDIAKEVAYQHTMDQFDSDNDVELDKLQLLSNRLHDKVSSQKQSSIDELHKRVENRFGGTSQMFEAPFTEDEYKNFFDEMYDGEIQKLVELKKNNDPNYEIELNNTIQKILSFTDRIPNAREQIETDIKYQLGEIERKKDSKSAPAK